MIALTWYFSSLTMSLNCFGVRQYAYGTTHCYQLPAPAHGTSLSSISPVLLLTFVDKIILIIQIRFPSLIHNYLWIKLWQLCVFVSLLCHCKITNISPLKQCLSLAPRLPCPESREWNVWLLMPLGLV